MKRGYLSGYVDYALADFYGGKMFFVPNIGPDQGTGYGYGPWSTCDSSLHTDGQLFKSHTVPIAAKKVTVFPGVASAGQIREAAE